MDTKKSLFVFVSIGLVLFLFEVIWSINFQPQEVISGIKDAAKKEAISSLYSKVISSIIAYGKVTNINGRDISLSSLGDILTISLTNDARIFSFDTPSAQQMVNLENIRIGDNVNISLKPLPDGKLQGSSVIILPVSNPGE